MPEPTKCYLGDGAFVELVDGVSVVITAENGERVTDRIVLDFEVYLSLLDTVHRLMYSTDPPSVAANTPNWCGIHQIYFTGHDCPSCERS